MGPATMVKLVSLRKFLRYTHTTHPHAPPYDTWHVIPKAPVYRIQDMHDFESQLCRIQQKIEQPTPDAQQRMDEFLLVRAQEIEDEKLIARRSENWSRSFYNTQHYYSLRLYKEIADSWSRRLTKLGFNPRIVSASFHAIHNVVKSNRVTKSNKKSFLKFEQEIMNAIFFGKHNHLQIQRSQRQKAVLEFYCQASSPSLTFRDLLTGVHPKRWPIRIRVSSSWQSTH
ncbi:hypothetical protein BJ165DRAFT_14075 [Panaeolus papilionaceus]|nr:hypothetical protein BJ165DRAFT_14075 [Panaeolus papilionaceus]